MAIHASKRSLPPSRRHNSSRCEPWHARCGYGRRHEPRSKRRQLGESEYLTQQKNCFGSVRFSFCSKEAATYIPSRQQQWPLVPKREGRCIFKKCLVLVDRLKQHESMNTKNYICILAGAVLLVSCAPRPTTTPLLLLLLLRPNAPAEPGALAWEKDRNWNGDRIDRYAD